MQYVNDDMDDLFRRAAKNYPLDTKSADWDKIAAELNLKPDKTNDGNTKNRKFLWLLLLLPLSFICNHIFNDGTQVVIKVNQSEPIKSSMKDLVSGQQGKYLQQDHGNVNNSIQQIDSKYNVIHRDTHSPTLRMHSVPVSAQIGMISGNSLQFNEILSRSQPVNYNDPEKELKNEREAFVLNNNYPFPVFNIHSVLPEPIVNQKEFVLLKGENVKQKKIYAGIMGGIDATSIKFQKVSNAGYSFGVLLGYKLNERWSIESGLFHDKKYYYSDGQYLNTAKMYILPGTKINSLDGNCSMWEMPLQARYSFKNSKNKVWFSTLGLSSYFMKKENYDYTYSYTSTGQTYDKYRSYNNASKHFFSVITLSAGFTNTIYKNLDLRVEPYLKIPVKGVGVGSISLQSAGIQVGVSKTIF